MHSCYFCWSRVLFAPRMAKIRKITCGKHDKEICITTTDAFISNNSIKWNKLYASFTERGKRRKKNNPEPHRMTKNRNFSVPMRTARIKHNEQEQNHCPGFIAKKIMCVWVSHIRVKIEMQPIFDRKQTLSQPTKWTTNQPAIETVIYVFRSLAIRRDKKMHHRTFVVKSSKHALFLVLYVCATGSVVSRKVIVSVVELSWSQCTKIDRVMRRKV